VGIDRRRIDAANRQATRQPEGRFHPCALGRCKCPAVSRRKILQKGMVRAEGFEPSRAVKLNGFSYRLRLSPPGRDVSGHARQVCGLDYPFTIPRKIRGLGAARLVSTPSRSGAPGLARDCHFRFPRIWAVLHRRFPGRALKFPQVRCVCRFRHARMAGLCNLFIISQRPVHISLVSKVSAGLSSFSISAA